MKKITFSTIVIILLLVLNSLTLAFMWAHQPGPAPFPPFGPPGPPFAHDRPHGPGMFLMRELSFDDKQKQEFEKLRDAHREKARTIQDSLHALKEQLFNGIPGGDMAQANAVADKIASFQKQLEIVTYEHFKQVRELCNDEQKQKFDKIIGRVLEMMAPPPPGMAARGSGGPPPGR